MVLFIAIGPNGLRCEDPNGLRCEDETLRLQSLLILTNLGRVSERQVEEMQIHLYHNLKSFRNINPFTFAVFCIVEVAFEPTFKHSNSKYDNLPSARQIAAQSH